ncbi:MAG: hypothetical protein A2Z93_13845 [Curvibacter sp. GWA2_64_110]|nr:MAG: hypothetical protein A2Z93_13845 [Curvibacter sp. GWA2_64_110]HCY17286.1 hypothetical protein [Curvibacter sp.]
MAVPAAARVIPVAPVNPSVQVQAGASVVNDINPEVQAKAASESAAQPSASDPLQGGSKADNSSKDWTQAAPKPKVAEEPPKEPLTQMLIEHVKTLWILSARAVDLMSSHNQDSNQVQNLAQIRNQDPSAIPGVLAKEVLTYSPSKIAKTGKPE